MAGSAKIDTYLDFNSPYSRFAFLHLRRYATQLKANNVEYEIHPVFLNGINARSGNKPPWTLEAKAKYGAFDGKRAQRYFGVKPMKAPPEFPINTLLALRSLCHIKSHVPKDTYELTFLELWTAAWEEGLNLSNPETVSTVYQRHLTAEQAGAALKASKDAQWKDQLKSNTETALAQGAFGAPWMWVRNSQGAEEPFFGSDRFHYMWDYLGIAHRDFEVLAPPGGGAKL